MTEEQLKELLTPEFLSTLQKALDYLYECPNHLGLTCWDEIDLLPVILEHFASDNYYD
jgi:hypothetical protein